MAKHNPGWVYVEHAIEYADGDTIFRSYLDHGENTKEVEQAALVDAEHAHPGAQRVEFFMSRRLTPERAEKIAKRMKDGTWAEWFTRDDPMHYAPPAGGTTNTEEMSR